MSFRQIEKDYEAVSSFSEGLAAVTNGEFLLGFMDKTGKEVVPLIYENVGWFSEGLAPVLAPAGCGGCRYNGESGDPVFM